MSPDLPPAEDSLGLFDPLVARWFAESVGKPTEVQVRAWPAIARGAHVLVSAPTGTGKTLTAFLWGMDRFVRGAWPPGKIRILYVSPLKALNNDIQKNLIGPLSGLSGVFSGAGREFPVIRTATRSGDTPASERRRMLRTPPEILITTPESLNLILSSPNARLMLDGVETVILDEIHAVASTKRGVHLMSAVERLARLSGEFQRIALSATVRPLGVVADFVGGFCPVKRNGVTIFEKRPVEIIHCPLAKEYRISVSAAWGGASASMRAPPPRAALDASGPPWPRSGAPAETAAQAPSGRPQLAAGVTAAAGDTTWNALAAECRRIIKESRSTLFFVNSRRHAEKLCRLVNEQAGEQLAWAHHGSLSRELRLVVEQRLKDGQLKAIAATSSLELGIDIGALDKVILIQTPFSVASTVQRMGRAGHRIGEASSAVIYALFGRDLVDAAVMAKSALDHDIEDVSPVLCPLDVLAQLMVSMAGVETWTRDGLYDAVRASFSFNSLSREHFELVLSMLCGKYAETRLRDLSPLLAFDALEGTVKAREGALMRLYSSGGTIPDRGYFSLRAADSGALIGELDEEFVWERAIGDSFFMGTQGWRIQSIDHQNVEVVPVKPGTAMAPFWKAEERNRSFHFSERLASALEGWTNRLEDPGLPSELVRDHKLSPDAAEELVRFLSSQKQATGSDLPHRHHLLAEHTADAQGAPGTVRVILHTLWGGRINRPFSLALAAAWEEKHGYAPEMMQDDDEILLLLPDDAPGADIVSLVTPETLDRLLRKKLEGSGFFGARFRECASRALLLPKSAVNRRMPLWFTRLRAKNLFAAVSRFDDFPILIETWRTCLRDEFDMESLVMLLRELASGAIRVTDARTMAPSPFCSGMMWKQTNTAMYEDDTPRGKGGTALRGDLIRELVLSSELRPKIRAEIAAELQEKLQRTAFGYAPRGGTELLEWIKERVVIPEEEWRKLLAACQRDHSQSAEELEAALEGKLSRLPGGGIVAREALPRIGKAVEQDDEALADILSQWLRFYGPVDPNLPRLVFGLDETRYKDALQDLVDEEVLIVDRLVDGSDAAQVCDRENLERLLRITRARARPAFKPLEARLLPLFAAQHQGLTRKSADAEAEALPAPGAELLQAALDKLFGFGLPARLWEEEVLPARFPGYRSAWLDSLFSGSALIWLGCGRERIAFCFHEDAELFTASRADQSELDGIFPGPMGKFGFWELRDHSGLSTSALTSALWRLAWSGAVSNDAFQTVRMGIENRFRAVESPDKKRRIRASFDRWRASRPAGGFWFRVKGAEERDALEAEEINRDRIRQVLQRYGVVFREMLESELPPLRWGELFRSLRLMELSGEVTTGRFFEGVPGLQFVSPQALEELKGPLDEEAVYWMNAADPASLCGSGLEALKGVLPARMPATHVVFHGARPVLVSRRQARDLEFRVPPEEVRIPDYFAFVSSLVNRDARPLSAVHVETINGEPAGASPYKGLLISFGFKEDFKRLTYRGGLT